MIHIDEALIGVHNENKILEAVARTAPNIRLLESTKRMITEETVFRKYIAYLLTKYKAFGKAITALDIRKAIENVLRSIQQERDWTDEELQAMISDQMSDEGIIGSIYNELRRRKIPYIVPR